MRVFGLQIHDRVLRLVQIAIAVGLMALMWRAADGPEAARSLVTADWRWLALALLALSVQTVLSALRWQLTARHLGITLDARHAVREYYLSQVVNQSLPGGMIGDASRAMRSREQAGLFVAAQAVVIERLAGQIAMFATLALCFAITFAVPGGLVWPEWLALPVALFVLAGICLPFLARAATYLPGTIGRASLRFQDVLLKTLASPQTLRGQVLLSLGTTICNLAAFAFCARAVGVDLSLGAITALVPLILFTMLIPISVSGWGLREGAAAALLPLAGATASGALAASVAFGLSFFVAVLPGFFLIWFKRHAADPRNCPSGTT